MNYDLLLLAGGRRRNDRQLTKQAAADVARALPVLKIAQAWIDEHGSIWLENKPAFRIAFSAGRLVNIDSSQLVVGGLETGDKVKKIWLMGDLSDYGNILEYIKFAGLEYIGSNELLVKLAEEKDFLPKLFPGWKFNKGGYKVWASDWTGRYPEIVDQILKNYSLPLVLTASEMERVVLLADDLENAIFTMLERSGSDYLEVSQTYAGVKKGVISFIGRNNFLPSRLAECSALGELTISNNKELERNLQNMLISMIKNYDFLDYGLFWVNIGQNEWEIERLELLPGVGRAGNLAGVWRLSGLNYNEMVTKIYQEATKYENSNSKGQPGGGDGSR